MADSIHDDGAGAGGAEDDFDLSAEDHSQDNADDLDSPENRTDADDSDDNSASNDDDDSGKTDDSDDAPTFDADLDDWAEKTGRGKPESDRERKLMQDIRNGQRDFSRNRTPSKAVELSKAITDATPKPGEADPIADPLEVKYNELERNFNQERTIRLQSEYMSEHNVTDAEVEAMGQILKEKADRGDLKAFEYLSDARNLGDLHDLVKIRMSKDAASDGTDVVAKAKEEERQRLAKISKSGGPSKSARSTQPASKKDALVELWESDD